MATRKRHGTMPVTQVGQYGRTKLHTHQWNSVLVADDENIKIFPYDTRTFETKRNFKTNHKSNVFKKKKVVTEKNAKCRTRRITRSPGTQCIRKLRIFGWRRGRKDDTLLSSSPLSPLKGRNTNKNKSMNIIDDLLKT